MKGRGEDGPDNGEKQVIQTSPEADFFSKTSPHDQWKLSHFRELSNMPYVRHVRVFVNRAYDGVLERGLSGKPNRTPEASGVLRCAPMNLRSTPLGK
jgi:hypothetical protein